MCGIAGIQDFEQAGSHGAIVAKMSCALSHRGPDAEGVFNSPGIAFAHRRLSIIDVSDASNQPFTDNSGRYTIVFNGELYNFQDVKAMIPEYAFHTTGDTEVMVAAYAKWGPGCLDHFRGMFAFAIWDNIDRELFLARDPLGVKPLYFFATKEKFVFASEVRAMLASGLIDRKVSMPALFEYFSYQSVSYPYSIVDGIEQLESGCWMKVKDGILRTRKYWDISTIRNKFELGDVSTVHRRIRDLMLQSVERRMVSDVPIGAFLSGGIDSSAVVGLMAEAGNARPNTFNISFEEKDFDESRYAELVAKKFNANHTRITLKPTVFLEELQNALDGTDSPSGDGINTYVVSKAIKQQRMPVALSGIGGDELFAGYPIFSQYMKLENKGWAWEMSEFVREVVAFGILPGLSRNKLSRIRQLIRIPACSIENIYPILRQILSPAEINQLTRLASPSFQKTEVQRQLSLRSENLKKLPVISQVSAAEYLGYTQHTLLKDTDQMSMAVSLEVREPFFDQDLVEYVLSVPDSVKKPTYAKSLLVDSLKPLIPDSVVFRKKQGFLFPWNLWLRNDLRSFCDTHIRNVAQRPFVNGDALLKYWSRFLKGDTRIRWSEIWLFVVLEYWLKKNDVN